MMIRSKFNCRPVEILSFSTLLATPTSAPPLKSYLGPWALLRLLLYVELTAMATWPMLFHSSDIDAAIAVILV